MPMGSSERASTTGRLLNFRNQTMRFTRALPTLLATVVLAGACTSDDPANAGPTGSTDLDTRNVALTSGLVTTGDCDALLDRLIEEGLERVGPYGFDSGYYGIDVMAGDEDSAMDDSSSAAAPATAEAGSAGESSRDFSGTNNQETGVDEPDLVKTDGDRLVVITGQRLTVIDTTGATPRISAELDLPNEVWATEMFLVDDRVFVMVQGWTDVGFGPRSMSRYGGSPTTQLVEVDLTSGDIGRTLEFEGSYLSAREIDGTIRFVVQSGMGHFPFVFPSNQAAEEGAETANRAIIADSTIDQWLSSYRLTENGAEITAGQLVDCDRMHLPADFAGFGTIAVLTIDGEAGLEPIDALGVVTDGQTIYASTDRLTVATARWPEFTADGQATADSDFATELHNFDITDPKQASYTGSGAVPGYLLSQYSLSEHNGYLRAATTAGDPWSGQESESMITVLEELDGKLVTVGQVDGLGKGERIFAVRFMGDVGYVVTFEQIDPLYIVDLSDPTNPNVTGELKIPGFSTYLHPIDDGLLLGVGQDATDEGFTTGGQVSAFDVSDMSNPLRVDQLDLGADSHSSVDWDPRAFTWWGPERIAFVPVSWWRWNDTDQTEDNGSQVVVVAIDADGNLVERGRIGHPVNSECERYETSVELEEELAESPPLELDDLEDREDPEAIDAEADLVTEGREAAPADEEPATIVAPSSPVEPDYCWSYQPEIRRSVIIGDTVYTVSEAGVLASHLNDFSDITWLATNQ
ncbi:MAG: hypothetical protein ACI8TP_002321 [Acidimicrobiales bacterium]|jgi:hypothetical protein